MFASQFEDGAGPLLLLELSFLFYFIFFFELLLSIFYSSYFSTIFYTTYTLGCSISIVWVNLLFAVSFNFLLTSIVLNMSEMMPAYFTNCSCCVAFLRVRSLFIVTSSSLLVANFLTSRLIMLHYSLCWSIASIIHNLSYTCCCSSSFIRIVIYIIVWANTLDYLT